MCSKCRFCCCGRSASVIAVALYTLIQSALFLAAWLFAVLAHSCSTDLDQNRYFYAMYLIYFRNPECGDVDLRKLGIDLDARAPLPSFLEGVTGAIDRTVLFGWLNVGFNAFWVLASLMLLIGGARSCSGKCGHYFFWQPWIVATLANIVLDVVAAIYFGIDLQSTGSLDEFLSWIGLRNIEELRPFIPAYESRALSIPPLAMMGLSLRFMVLEVINVVCLIVVTFIWFEILGEFVSSGSRPQEYLRNGLAKTNRGFEPDSPEYPRVKQQNGRQVDSVSMVSSQTATVSVPESRPNYSRSQSAVKSANLSPEVDEDVEQRLRSFQKTTPRLNPEAFAGRREVQQTRLTPTRAEPAPDYKLDSVPEALTDIPAPDYDSEPEMAPPKERNPVTRSSSNVQNLRINLERNVLFNRNSATVESPKSAREETSQVSRNNSFINRPELRNQLPWSYFKGEDSSAKNFYVHPITGERMSRARIPSEQIPESQEDETKSRF